MVSVSGGNQQEERPGMTDQNEAWSQGDLTPKTILVVEDDQYVGEFIAQALTNEGQYHVVLATDAFRALNIVRNLKPALFLLDYQLPQMNGIELYDRLQKAGGLDEVPVLFVSANPPQEELNKRQIYSMKKPFELEEFLQKVKELLAD